MKKILVATDFSDLARRSYVAAASLATAYGAKIGLVHEVEALPPMYRENFSESLDASRYHDHLQSALYEELEHDAWQGIETEAHLVYNGGSERNLIDFARNEDIDLIVLSTHGRTGLSHVLLGSFAERVCRLATVPVLTHRSQGHIEKAFQARSILAPFDLSENSEAAFPILRSLCEHVGAKVTMLHVLPEVSVRGDWGDVQERLRVSAGTATKSEEKLRQLCDNELPGMNVSVESRYGDTYDEILKEAHQLPADLVVMATHGWTGMKHLYFGSIAEKVLRTSPCSVLTVRPNNVQ